MKMTVKVMYGELSNLMRLAKNACLIIVKLINVLFQTGQYIITHSLFHSFSCAIVLFARQLTFIMQELVIC